VKKLAGALILGVIVGLVAPKIAGIALAASGLTNAATVTVNRLMGGAANGLAVPVHPDGPNTFLMEILGVGPYVIHVNCPAAGGPRAVPGTAQELTEPRGGIPNPALPKSGPGQH
jgi:hypothetical protein